MSLISSLLPRDNVLVDLDVGSKKRVFEHAGDLFSAHQHLDANAVFESLFSREKLGSTGLGQGVAIPHGRIRGLREAVGAVVKVKEPIPFDAPDGAPVKLMFILLVPENATDIHLQILGELAELFSNQRLRDRMLNTRDAGELFGLITSQIDDSDHRSAPV